MIVPAPCPESRLAAPLRVRRVPFEAIPRATWDGLLAVTTQPTPFSRWTFHRAWWDAYGVTAEPCYLMCSQPGTEDIVGIVPLMTRAGTSDPPAAPSGRTTRTMFMAASYHADYATILCDPTDLRDVAEAAVRDLADEPPGAWDTIDLRRLRYADPSLHELAEAFRVVAPHLSVAVGQEDVCPVTTLPENGDWDAYLATLTKKARHEIRRKVRRAESVGTLSFCVMPLDGPSVDVFIRLHQERWGERGLYPETPDGDRNRRFLRRLTELEAAEGGGAQLQLGKATVGDRTVFASVGFDDGVTCFFYNAGTDPEARGLSPGVTGTAAYLRDRMASGRARFDFLRGNEPYKYEWGAQDEPIGRIVVTRARP